MTVTEALEHFENIPRVKRKLQTMYDVGLGYIRLGQPATQLSGGEAQRGEALHRAVPNARRDGRCTYSMNRRRGCRSRTAHTSCGCCIGWWTPATASC